MVDASVVPGTLVEGEFRIGGALNKSLSILGRNFVPLALLGAIATLPYLYVYWLEASALHSLGQNTAMSPAQQVMLVRKIKGLAPSMGLAGVLALLLYIIGQASIFYGVMQVMCGRHVQVGESLRVGLSRFLPIIVMMLCEGIGIMFGFVLLIIPAFILFTMWYVALPVSVAERLGPFRSLGRSAALTKGHRWKVFGVIFLLALVGGIFGNVVTGIVSSVDSKIFFTVGQYAFQAVYLSFHCIVIAVIYHDLRIAKEGGDTDAIAAVFD